MKRKRFLSNLILCLLVLSAFLVLSSSYFDIHDIEIIGNEKLTEKYILDTAGLTDRTNIFMFNTKDAVKKIKSNAYVDSIVIQKEYPGKLYIKIDERRLSGYIEYMGAYLYLDENGRVLEVSTYYTERLPVVTGLDFTGFNVGEKLPVKNTGAFDVMVTLAQLFNKYDLEGDIIKVDISKESDIHIYIKRVDVEFGNINDADEKIRTLTTIMDKLPDGGDTPGFLYLADIKKTPNARFRLLS